VRVHVKEIEQNTESDRNKDVLLAFCVTALPNRASKIHNRQKTMRKVGSWSTAFVFILFCFVLMSLNVHMCAFVLRNKHTVNILGLAYILSLPTVTPYPSFFNFSHCESV